MKNDDLRTIGEWANSGDIFHAGNQDFTSAAIRIFRYQYKYNTLYRKFTDVLGIAPETVKQITQIPFLPISFFKSAEIKTGDFTTDYIFESSGTTGTVNSKHFIKDIQLYTESFLQNFISVYGDTNDWCMLGLLPSYLERGNSSLVYMVDQLIRKTNHPLSGFYLSDFNHLHQTLQTLAASNQKTILFGVTFALLDLAEQFEIENPNCIIIETGGMKGRKKEMIRSEFHEVINGRLHPKAIHSEYGMTELLSQAYAKDDGIFYPPSWMKILMRNENDPFDIAEQGTGLLNIVDLANIYSCAFIATDDIGRLYADGGFEVLGRMDNADMRGCSLLTA